MTTVKLLEYLAKYRMKISEVVSYLPEFHLAEARADCPSEAKGSVMRRLNELQTGRNGDNIEGIRIQRAPDEWVHVAPDPDSPYFTVVAEACSDERAQSLVDEYRTLDRGHGAVGSCAMTTLSDITLATPSATATHDLGRRLGEAVGAGQVIALRGDLGAGKTTLTQGIAAGLGITARVTSPTFTLVNEYAPGSRRLRLVHIDIYRLGDTPETARREVATFGLDEIFATATWPDVDSDGSVIVIEWAEKIAPLLPADHLDVHLVAVSAAPDDRQITLTAFGPQSAALRDALTG